MGAARLTVAIAFMIVGIATLTDPFNKFNPYHIGLGIIVGLFFSLLYGSFLKIFLGALNRDYKKEHGKKAIRRVVGKGKLFIIPFAVMMLLATFVLNWPMTIAFVSAGFMAMGTAAALEMGLARGKPELKNTIATAAVSFAFSLLWTLSYPLLIKAPFYLEGGVRLLLSFVGGGQ